MSTTLLSGVVGYIGSILLPNLHKNPKDLDLSDEIYRKSHGRKRMLMLNSGQAAQTHVIHLSMQQETE